jgi:PPOX class probable F420-dependent enzyme
MRICRRHRLLEIEGLRTEWVLVGTSSADGFSLVIGETTFAIMTAELTQEVSRRLESDRYGWLTTVAKSGQPVPRLVWFFFDGNDLTVYSMPSAAKVTHIKARPRVSLNLDSDGNGTGTVVVGGEARVDAVDADPLADEQYQAKYHGYAVSMGMSDEYLAAFTTRLKISVDKVWTTPPASSV